MFKKLKTYLSQRYCSNPWFRRLVSLLVVLLFFLLIAAVHSLSLFGYLKLISDSVG